jgi:hypothetical protein
MFATRVIFKLNDYERLLDILFTLLDPGRVHRKPLTPPTSPLAHDGATNLDTAGCNHTWHGWHSMLVRTTSTSDMAQLPYEEHRRVTRIHDASLVD